MVDLLPDFQKSDSILVKSVPIHSPIYKDHKFRGLLYVYNGINANIVELLSGMKGLGFVEKKCITIQILMDKIKADVSNSSKYKDDYCVAVLTITNKRFKEENDLIRNFHGDICKNLQCKPKLFFFLTIPQNPTPYTTDSVDATDGCFEYVLAHEADLFIYKDTSSDAIKDLSKFIKILNTKDKGDFFVADEITSHLSTIKRPKLEENLKSKVVTRSKPTIHDSLTRRLYLGPKAVVSIDKKKLLNKRRNLQLLSVIAFIEDEMDINELDLDDIDLESLKNEIKHDPSCEIPESIRKKVNSITNKHLGINESSMSWNKKNIALYTSCILVGVFLYRYRW